jgi:hypothetical protein
MRLRLLLPMLGLATCSILAAACTTEDPKGSDDGGAGGEGATSGKGGTGGSAAEPGGAGEAGVGGVGAGGDFGAGGDCATDGTGTLLIEVSGLPDGVAPDIDISGPIDLNATESGALEGVDAGGYSISAARVFDEDPLVRTVFEGTVNRQSLCVAEGRTTKVQVEYLAIPTSNKLWMPTGLDEEGAAFSSAKLDASGTTDASVLVDGDVGKSVAFDRDGNLWTLGNSAEVRRFSAASLATSGDKEPDVSFTLPEIDCAPGLSSLALDQSGNLWLSSACADMVVRVPAEELTGTGEEKISDVLIAGATAADGLAFDRDGNLWVAGGVTLARYDASRLGEPTGEAPDLSIDVKDGAGELMAAYLAFDKAGNLWSVPLAGPLFQIAASDLEGTGTKTVDVNVSIALDVEALAHQPAFDDSNGLWLSWTDGRVARLAPEQLGTSATPGSPVTPSVVIQSASVGASLPLAFFPAPQGLPLYHSIPEE